MSCDPAQPQYHRNVVLTRFLARMFYTSYKQTDNMNYSLFLIYFVLFENINVYVSSPFLTLKKKLTYYYPKVNFLYKRL